MYRARLAEKGKLVRVVDATAFKTLQAGQAVPTVPGFDPKTQFVYDRACVEKLWDNFRNALSKLVLLREEEAERLRTRNAQLEADLKRAQQHHTIDPVTDQGFYVARDNILKRMIRQSMVRR